MNINKPNNVADEMAPVIGNHGVSRRLRGQWVALLVVAAILVASNPTMAQTTNVINVYTTNATPVTAAVSNMKTAAGAVVRMSVPVNNTGFYATTLTFTLGGAQSTFTSGVTNDTDPMNVYVTNTYDISPAVATMAATGVPATGGGAGVAFSPGSVTNYGTGNLNASVIATLNYTNVTSGEYDMAINAASANTWRFPMPVTAGYQWSSTAAAADVTNAASWLGGVAPGAGDFVIIPDVSFGNATTPSILVTTNTEIAGLRDVHNGNSTFPNFNVAAGATLSVTGNGGYRQLRDTLDSNSRAFVQASGAGTLLVSNANANFDLFVYAENTQNNFMFDKLNELKLDVSRISIDDIWAYPNILTNGSTTAAPRRYAPRLYLALTNIFHATLTDANDWTNQNRDYSFVIARARAGGGTGTDFDFRLGLQNEFYFDSMLLGGAGNQCDSGTDKQIDFNTALTGNKLLYLRGASGGRMANLTIADAATPGGQQSSGTKINVILTSGSIDALVDTLYMGRNATNANGAQATARLDVSAGTLDANNVYLGYQTGAGADLAGSTGVGYCAGTINLSATGTFIVNSNLVLGYAEESAATTFGADQGYGQLNLSGGAAAYVNTVSAGGSSGATLANINQKITLSSGSRLVVSNGICTAGARLNALSMSDSSLGLRVNLDTSNPYVYCTTLTTGGTSNELEIVSVSYSGSPSYPVQIPLISYTGSAAPNFVLKLPPGYYGYIINNSGASTIDAVITTTAPKNLVWNGNVNGNWDASTANWFGSQVFANGDTVAFDDSASGVTSVTIPVEVTPGSGGVSVSNNLLSYTFVSGTISGTGLMLKQGTNNLTINAASSLPVALNEGSLMVGGSGSVGATVAAVGTTVFNAGTINKLTTASTSVNTGTINIGLSVIGGTMDNAGTVNGTFGTSNNSVTTNRLGATITHTGVATVAAGSTLICNGLINNGTANADSRLGINGYLMGAGTVSDTTGDTAGNNGRVEITSGGIFMPGGSNVIGTFTISGRFDLSTATPLPGTLIIDVDMNNPAKNDVVAVDKWSNIRGALVMNNIGSIPFAAGQQFLIVSNNYGLPNTPEAAFDTTNKITPVVPGVGLQWDYSNLRTNGIIAVVQAPLTPPLITESFAAGALTINWDKNHLGYQLQVQTNNLSVGISTNWFPVSGSENTNSWSVTVDSGAPSVFYRLSNQ
jgi:hypothetical protein